MFMGIFTILTIFFLKSNCPIIFQLLFLLLTFLIEFFFSKLTVPGSVQMYLVRNLQPNTLYEFEIVANGPFGKSKSAALGSALNSGKRNIRNYKVFLITKQKYLPNSSKFVSFQDQAQVPTKAKVIYACILYLKVVFMKSTKYFV